MATSNPPKPGPTQRGRSQTAPAQQGRRGSQAPPARRSGAWPSGGSSGARPWGRFDDDPSDSDTFGAPRDDTFGEGSDEWPRDDVMGGRGRRGTGFDEFGSSSFDGGFGADGLGDSFGSGGFGGMGGFDSGGADTFGDAGSDTFDGGDFGGGGGFDQYGFGDSVDTSKCGCYDKKEDLVNMDQLAQHLYDLLRREVFVERERIGAR